MNKIFLELWLCIVFINLRKKNKQQQQSKQMRHVWDQVMIVIRRALGALYTHIYIGCDLNQ